jgi:hypothetical protein
VDPDKRLKILEKIHQLTADDPGALNLLGLDMIYAMQDRIEYTWTPNEAFVFNVHTIRIVK